MFNNSKLDRAMKRQSKAQSSQPDEGYKKLSRASYDGQSYIFCEKISPASDLRQVMTMNLNNRLHECARTLKLSGGDAIAQELKYHSACLRSLYNRERSHLKALEKRDISE